MFCKNCGKEIKDDSIYCPSCGEKIGEVSSNEAEGQVNANALSDSQVLRKYGCSSRTKISFVFSIICFVAVWIFSSILYVGSIARGDDS